MIPTPSIHTNFVNKVTLLTSEIEKLSDVLILKGQEVEMLILANQKVTQSNHSLGQDNQRLTNELYNLAEHLKLQTIKHEELNSSYNRLKMISLKDIETECDELCQMNENLTKTIQLKEQDLVVAKEQFINKTKELQQANQQVYHFENAIRLVKEEKLRYVHEYQQKDKEIVSLQQKLQEMSDFEVRYKNSLVDMELVRSNYGALFNQKESDRSKLNEQLNIQRELSSNNIEQVESKYIDIIKRDKELLKEEYESKLKSVVLQLENHVTTLTNRLDTKQQDFDRMQMQLENNVMRMRQEFTKDIQARNATITDLNNNNNRLMQLLQQTNQDVFKIKESAGKGQTMNKQELESLQDTVSQLTEQIHAYEARCHELQNQHDRIQMQLKEQVVDSLNDVSTIKKVGKRFDNMDIQSEEKINYLLKVIGNKNTQLEQRDNRMSQMSQMPRFSVPNM